MSELVLVLPIALPLAAAATGLLARSRPAHAHALGIGSLAAVLAIGVGLAIQSSSGAVRVAAIGGWPPPFGIALVADTLSALMLALTGAIGLAAAAHALGESGAEHHRNAFPPLLQILVAGACGVILAGDLFNLYVWLEVTLIASFALMALDGSRAQLEGTLKYAFANLAGSTLLLAGIGLLYGMTGTVNLAHLAQRLPQTAAPELLGAVSVLFVVALGTKAALFPLAFWLPASYPTAPGSVAALFAGLLTKLGVYVLLRVLTLLFPADVGVGSVLLALAAGTLVTGVAGAAAQSDLRRLLAFLVLPAMGFMALGLALRTPLALASALYFLLADAVALASLFLVADLVRRLRGTSQVGELGGLYAAHPVLAIVFLVPALSLAGCPPLAGFWGKLALVRASLGVGAYASTALVLAVSLCMLGVLTRVWSQVFLQPGTHAPSPDETLPTRQLVPSALLAAGAVCLGLGASPLYTLAERAAHQLLQPQPYIEAVLKRCSADC